MSDVFPTGTLIIPVKKLEKFNISSKMEGSKNPSLIEANKFEILRKIERAKIKDKKSRDAYDVKELQGFLTQLKPFIPDNLHIKPGDKKKDLVDKLLQALDQYQNI